MRKIFKFISSFYVLFVFKLFFCFVFIYFYFWDFHFGYYCSTHLNILGFYHNSLNSNFNIYLTCQSIWLNLEHESAFIIKLLSQSCIVFFGLLFNMNCFILFRLIIFLVRNIICTNVILKVPCIIYSNIHSITHVPLLRIYVKWKKIFIFILSINHFTNFNWRWWNKRN